MAAAMKRIVGRFRGVLIPLLALAAVDRVVLRKIEAARFMGEPVILISVVNRGGVWGELVNGW